MRNRIRRIGGDALRRVMDYADAHGWTAEQTNSNHVRLTKAGCRAVTCSLTSSCQFSYKKAIGDMKRAEKTATEETQ